MRKPAAPSVAPIALRRPRCPSFMSSTARAPADCALRAFTAKKQVPRCTSATAPRGNRRKSARSHPLVDEFGGPGGSRRSTPDTRAVTKPEPEYVAVRKSRPARNVLAPGWTTSSRGWIQLAEELQRKAVEPRRVAGRAERPAHVADGGVAAALPAARLPPFVAAIAWSAARCWRMLASVTLLAVGPTEDAPATPAASAAQTPASTSGRRRCMGRCQNARGCTGTERFILRSVRRNSQVRLVDVPQESEHALPQLCGRLLVVVGEAAIGEQMLIARIQEQLRIVGRLDERTCGGEVFERPLVPLHHVDLDRHPLRPGIAELEDREGRVKQERSRRRDASG